ncbi:MAG TPA: hypothetical protein VEJ63_06305 [Planctomycetota bacterium]|nr:hypothetical protein [Planctomycetota bacterium]
MVRFVAVFFSAFIACSTVYSEEPKKDPPKKEEPKKDAPAKDVKDMTLDELEAAGICPVTKKASKPIYHVKLGEKTYHFATRDAAKEFQANPEKFGAKKDEKKDEKKEEKK